VRTEPLSLASDHLLASESGSVLTVDGGDV